MPPSKPTSRPDQPTTLINRHTEDPPRDAVWIGRGSPWGNPFKLDRDGGRGEVLFRYRGWLEAQPPRYLEDIRRRLRGQVLACVCAPLACHGDFLVAIAEDHPWPEHGVNQLHLFE